ncbi:hypothetical protein [Pedobacter caeni]|uniref:Uncharacterized protein n=1 Tax=Pedobacter caeni TaxID=288992 RepID=A0A1M4V752_9SPHI|nr:hypothetical protein [Pedobacter caeni]SHE64816.1 hypothetical protein SAMN04488522_101803 [Pedobacter caeni]
MNQQLAKFYYLFLVFLVSIECFGQINPTNPVRNIQNAGSALKLKGKALQVNIFISAKEGPAWTRKAKDMVLKVIPESDAWLKRELKKYQHTMKISHKTFGYDQDIRLKSDADPDAGNVKWPTEILKRMGYASPMDFYRQLKKDIDFDQMYIVFFINTEGQSYSNPCDIHHEKDQEAFVESVAVFKKYEGKAITDKSERYVIPHEILHLFGALDLYDGEHQTHKTEKFAIRKLRNSIMLGSVRFQNQNQKQWELPKYEIDEFNAYMMGLHNNYQKWYDQLSKKFAKFYE